MVSSDGNSIYPNIRFEEVVRLTEYEESPYCDFCIDYAYLDEADDSIAALINRSIQREFLGEAYSRLHPAQAVDSFKNDYLRNYLTETGKIYQADVEKVGMTLRLPGWYTRIYSLVTFLEEGYNGTVTASSNTYCDMGGAHPNQYAQWLNFDGSTGKLLTREEVFPAEVKPDIERMLLAKLIEQQAALYPDETIETLEDLHKKGILEHTNMYIPHNFLLVKDEVLFLFNRYDIGPYSAGEIVLGIDYEEIGPYLKLN